jgi:glycosyltransferase involved in cell wall biosynthesis
VSATRTGPKPILSTRRRILVASGDVLSSKMAGPAIRAWHIAVTLSREHDVQLVTTLDCDLSNPAFPVRHVDDRDLVGLEAWADVVIFQGHLMRQHAVLRNSSKVIVVDIYDPFHLEVLEQARDMGGVQRRLAVWSCTEVLNEQLMRGDFFLCASRKQRDFWLGQLTAVGRINPLTYDQSENLDSLIAVVPFGVTEAPPRHTRNVLRGVVPGIGPDDKIILWGGGIYNWFDPLTLLRAIDKLRRRMPEVRLFFLGLKHPNPYVGEMRTALQTLALADELGLTGTHAFFNEDWVEYDDRQNYLLEADIGVSTHLDHVETAFSFRTRILDYLWASLPTVATSGDGLAEVIEAEGIGLIVPPGDVDTLEDALWRLLGDDELHARCRERMQALAPSYRWSEVLRPLIEFCREPERAPDLLDPEISATVRSPLAGSVWVRGWRHDLRLARAYMKERKWRLLLSKVMARASAWRRPT